MCRPVAVHLKSYAALGLCAQQTAVGCHGSVGRPACCLVYVCVLLLASLGCWQVWPGALKSQSMQEANVITSGCVVLRMSQLAALCTHLLQTL